MARESNDKVEVQNQSDHTDISVKSSTRDVVAGDAVSLANRLISDPNNPYTSTMVIIQGCSSYLLCYLKTITPHGVVQLPWLVVSKTRNDSLMDRLLNLS